MIKLDNSQKQIINILSLPRAEMEEYLYTNNAVYYGLDSEDDAIEKSEIALLNVFDIAFDLTDEQLTNTSKEISGLIEQISWLSSLGLDDQSMAFMSNESSFFWPIMKRLIADLSFELRFKPEIPFGKFDVFLGEFGFTTEEKNIDYIYSLYPFESWLEAYQVGKNLPITEKERKVYGNFSEEYCSIMKVIFDRLLNSLKLLTSADGLKKIQYIKEAKNEIENIKNKYKNAKNYDLLNEQQEKDLEDLIKLICAEIGV